MMHRIACETLLVVCLFGLLYCGAVVLEMLGRINESTLYIGLIGIVVCGALGCLMAYLLAKGDE